MSSIFATSLNKNMWDSSHQQFHITMGEATTTLGRLRQEQISCEDGSTREVGVVLWSFIRELDIENRSPTPLPPAPITVMPWTLQKYIGDIYRHNFTLHHAPIIDTVFPDRLLTLQFQIMTPDYYNKLTRKNTHHHYHKSHMSGNTQDSHYANVFHYTYNKLIIATHWINHTCIMYLE